MLSTSLMCVVSQMLLRPSSGQGRIAAHEIMMVNPAIRNLIRENKLHQIPSIMQTAKGEGMQTMAFCLKRMAQKGRLTRKQAMVASNDPHLFDDEHPPASGRHQTIGRR